MIVFAAAARLWPLLRDRGHDFEALQALLEPVIEVALPILTKYARGALFGGGRAPALKAIQDALAQMPMVRGFGEQIKAAVLEHERERAARASANAPR